jgi:ABC-type uncharacterized transport system substrate-binding protein
VAKPETILATRQDNPDITIDLEMLKALGLELSSSILMLAKPLK